MVTDFLNKVTYDIPREGRGRKHKIDVAVRLSVGTESLGMEWADYLLMLKGYFHIYRMLDLQ